MRKNNQLFASNVTGLCFYSSVVKKLMTLTWHHRDGCRGERPMGDPLVRGQLPSPSGWRRRGRWRASGTAERSTGWSPEGGSTKSRTSFPTWPEKMVLKRIFEKQDSRLKIWPPTMVIPAFIVTPLFLNLASFLWNVDKHLLTKILLAFNGSIEYNYPRKHFTWMHK